MAICANCSEEAYYSYMVVPSKGIDYCSKHLPRFAKGNASLVISVKERERLAKNAAKKSKAAEEPAVVVEETPVVVEEIIETVEPQETTEETL